MQLSELKDAVEALNVRDLHALQQHCARLVGARLPGAFLEVGAVYASRRGELSGVLRYTASSKASRMGFVFEDAHGRTYGPAGNRLDSEPHEDDLVRKLVVDLPEFVRTLAKMTVPGPDWQPAESEDHETVLRWAIQSAQAYVATHELAADVCATCGTALGATIFRIRLAAGTCADVCGACYARGQSPPTNQEPV